MSYFISVSDTVRDHFLDESNLRYLRVVIDPDGTPATYTPRDISCDASEDYQKWSFSIKNRTGLSVGLHANMAATVDVSHNGSTWLTVFTGFVSDDGFNRHRGLVTDDYLSLDLVDATKRKGTKRKPTPVLLSSFTASNPSAESSSVLHYLANQMGVAVEAAEIDYTIDLIELGKSTVWAELQALRDAYHADMYFRYDGKLLFHSPFDTGYSAPSSEWTFQGDPAEAVSGAACRIYGVVSEAYVPVRCNYAKTSFDDYDLLTERIIYKNTEAFDESSGLISIALDAGAYWPGPSATDVARLEYKDPESGADYPFAIDIVTPTLGAVGAGKDIESTGGSLEIVSVNGSTTATSAEGGATQIILYNNSAEPCTIRKLTVRGKPYQLKEQVKVEHVDAAVTDAVDYVEQEVNGRYAASASQMFDTLYHMVEEGKGRPRQFAFAAPFMPWIQRRAIVTVQMPGEEAVRCRIDSYAHRNRGKTMQGMHTTLVCTELGTHTPTGSPYVETTPAIPAWQAKLTSIAPNAGATYRSASTSAPVTPFLGDLWYQTDTQLMKRYDGSAWQNVGTSPFDESEDTGVSFETPSKKVQILDDGTIKGINLEIVDGSFSGDLLAYDSNLGSIETGTYFARDTDDPIIYTASGHTKGELGQYLYSLINLYLSLSSGYMAAHGTYGSKTIAGFGGYEGGTPDFYDEGYLYYTDGTSETFVQGDSTALPEDLTLWAGYKHASIRSNLMPVRDGGSSLGNSSFRFGSGAFSGGITCSFVDTGQGQNELYDMDQNVKTTSEPTFAGLTVTGDLVEQSTTQWSLGSKLINASATYVLPRGTYQFYRENPAESAIRLEVKDSSTWYTIGSVVVGLGTVTSDGTNMRLNNTSDSNITVYWRKKP